MIALKNVSKQLRFDCVHAKLQVWYVLVLTLYFDGHVLEKTLQDNDHGKRVMGDMCRGHPQSASVQTALIVTVTRSHPVCVLSSILRSIVRKSEVRS